MALRLEIAVQIRQRKAKVPDLDLLLVLAATQLCHDVKQLF